MNAIYQLFLDQVDEFCRRNEMTESALGKAAINDPNIIHETRRGRRPNLDLITRIQNFMDEYDRAFVE